MTSFLCLVLTTALLYCAGTADVLPVKVNTIHSRRPNSIPVTAKEKKNPAPLLSEYLLSGGNRDISRFLIGAASSKPPQSLEKWNKAHRCVSSEASVSLGARLGSSISQLSPSLPSLADCRASRWLRLPLSARNASYRPLIERGRAAASSGTGDKMK